jgi:hypothetical protein
MLLSGPPSALIFVEPRIQVNPVVHQPPPEPDRWHAELNKEGDSDAEIGSGLLPRETANFPLRQNGIVHFIRRPCVQSSCRSRLDSAAGKSVASTLRKRLFLKSSNYP